MCKSLGWWVFSLDLSNSLCYNRRHWGEENGSSPPLEWAEDGPQYLNPKGDQCAHEVCIQEESPVGQEAGYQAQIPTHQYRRSETRGLQGRNSVRNSIFPRNQGFHHQSRTDQACRPTDKEI